MRIPVAEGLGNRVAPALQGPRGMMGDGGVGAAAQRVAGAVGQIGQGLQANREFEERQAKQEQDAADRVRAAEAIAAFKNNAATTYDEISRGVMDGAIPADKASSELQTRLGKAKETLGSLPPSVAGMANVHAMEVEGSVTRSLGGVLVKRKQVETAASIDGLGENLARDAVRQGNTRLAAEQYAAAIDLAGAQAGWTPEAIQKKKQAFAESTSFAVFESQGSIALTQGSVEGIGEVLKRVEGKEGETLDPLRRSQLRLQLHGWQQGLIAKEKANGEKEAREAQAREKRAVDAYSQAVELMSSGRFLAPEYVKDLSLTAAGTQVEGAVGALLGQQSEVAGFATRTAGEREQILARMRAPGSTPGKGTTPEQQKIVASFERIDANARSGFKENPWVAAQQSGVIPQIPALDTSTPANLLGSVRTRLQVIGQIETWGGAKVSPLQPQEAEQFSKFARALPPDQAASLLGQVGLALGDAERVGAVGRQVHDKDGTLGLAMGMASTQTTEGRYAAELVLRGDQAIKDGIVKPDSVKVTGWKAEIAKKVRGAYVDQQAEGQVIQAAYLIAAAKDGDIDNAVRIATGGGIIEFNGSKVPMPVGYAADGGQSGAEDRFRKEIGKIDPAQLFDQVPDGKVYVSGVPMAASEFLKKLPDSQLIAAGGNRYAVRGGTGVVVNAAGRPVFVTLPK